MKAVSPAPTFASVVRQGLTARPKTLPAYGFYDALGSQLFEAICELPWYPITRAEMALLRESGPDMVEGFDDATTELCELGSGSGEKLALLLAGFPCRQALPVHLIDVSERALTMSKAAVERLGGVRAVTHCATYEEGLDALEGSRGNGRVLALFLGSNIGNFDPPAAAALMAHVRRSLRPGDGLLVGTDLVRAEADLILAYDDPLGVTAAFNKNLLQRLNAELGADFDLGAFRHRAVWDSERARVEMHLVSTKKQRVRVAAAEVTVDFAEGESIWTESSYKYTPDRAKELGRKAGFKPERQWLAPGGTFAATLFLAQ